MANACTSLPWTFILFLLPCLDWYKFFFYMGHTSLRWSYMTCYNPPFIFSICAAKASTITHLLAYFVIMRTPNSIKTDNGPAYISRQFKQFLLSFSIKHIRDIPCNPQIRDIVKEIHHTQKLQKNFFLKGGNA